uniref:tumor necrosis factor receptor superfamily member 1A isoform X2 n=1 Tax=Scatophagus argus TaxID=75038 RepID=UPI001ED824C0|nr:tumor necrosis factor receptor superfamily member 1A isoform X2 [Scatophagus argus]XP_046253570.1 tumor necrosis factor receptor superfamily member 1A isoform X2 [Scatophagus argus]
MIVCECVNLDIIKLVIVKIQQCIDVENVLITHSQKYETLYLHATDYEVEIEHCSFNRNVVCDCKDKYYNVNLDPNKRDCQPCPCEDCKGDGNKMDKCLENPECRRKCTSTTVPPNVTPSATTTIFMTASETATAKRTTSSSSTLNPGGNNFNPQYWVFLMGFVMLFLVFFWLMLLFTRSPIRNCDSPCWRAKKDLELPAENSKFNEQYHHQDSSVSTLTFKISEETPMMTLSQSPATTELPAHITPILPDAEHKAAIQDEQTEHWPAVVLYAIIKEVPLRRWKEFLRLLSVGDQQLERVELEAGLGLGSIEKQYQMLRLWSQRASASLNEVFSALHYMDLSGCAQLLQESLEKLQCRPEQK